MSLTVKKCAACQHIIQKQDYLICSKCELNYDIECVNITNKSFKQMGPDRRSTWVCPECYSKQPKVDNKNTPARPVHFSSNTNDSFNPDGNLSTPSNVTIRSSKRLEQALHSPGPEFLSEKSLRSIMKEILEESVLKQLRDMQKQMSIFHDSFEFINKQYEDMKDQLREKSAIIKNLQDDNLQLKSSLTDITTRLHLVEQHMRENNLEINGIPENKNENLNNTLEQLVKVVGDPIRADDILQVTRVAKLHKESDRPRTVIAKLRSTRHRDAVLAAVANFNKKDPQNKLCSQHLGIGGMRKPVYVNEHLTPSNKSLHAAARIKAKEKNYKFVWIRNGRIYIRKDESSQAHHIRCSNNLNLII